MKYAVFALATAVLHGCTGSPSSSNQAGAFGGQTVRIIVPFGPGGGFDLNARLLAQRLGTYMPGNPTVVVENMPGAGDVVAARYFAHQARPDGLSLGVFSTALALLCLTAEESESALDLSLSRFAIVGVPNPDRQTEVWSQADFSLLRGRLLLRAHPINPVSGGRYEDSVVTLSAGEKLASL